MAPPVYTELLISVNDTHSSTHTVEPASPDLWIITDISGHFTPPGTGAASIEVQVDGVGWTKWVCPVNRGRNVHWEGRQVVEPGSTLTIVTVCDLSTRVSITGYQLTPS